MENDYSYLKGRLCCAVDRLALGEKDIRSRLVDLYNEMHTIDAEDFPLEFIAPWNTFVKEIQKRDELIASDGEVLIGRVEMTMRSIKNKTAKKLAEIIYKMYQDMIVLRKYEIE